MSVIDVAVTVFLNAYIVPLPMFYMYHVTGRNKIVLREFGVYQWYQWYTNIVQGFTSGTIGNTICTNGNANGTIGAPNCTIGTIGKPMVTLVNQWYHWLPMVPLVKLPMVPLGKARTEPLYCNRYSGLRESWRSLENMRKTKEQNDQSIRAVHCLDSIIKMIIVC